MKHAVGVIWRGEDEALLEAQALPEALFKGVKEGVRVEVEDIVGAGTRVVRADIVE